jgi:hypothetical protein
MSLLQEAALYLGGFLSLLCHSQGLSAKQISPAVQVNTII